MNSVIHNCGWVATQILDHLHFQLLRPLGVKTGQMAMTVWAPRNKNSNTTICTHPFQVIAWLKAKIKEQTSEGVLHGVINIKCCCFPLPLLQRLQSDVAADAPPHAAQWEDSSLLFSHWQNTTYFRTPAAGCCAGCLILFIISTSDPQPPADKEDER